MTTDIDDLEAKMLAATKRWSQAMDAEAKAKAMLEKLHKETEARGQEWHKAMVGWKEMVETRSKENAKLWVDE